MDLPPQEATHIIEHSARVQEPFLVSTITGEDRERAPTVTIVESGSTEHFYHQQPFQGPRRGRDNPLL
jgi:predicted class III extradiol MEMO1 family dioxygenase